MRSSLRGNRRPGAAWALDGVVGWIGVDAEERTRYFTTIGTPDSAARLLVAVAAELAVTLPSPRVSLPRGTPAELPAGYRLENPVDWDFRWTARAPERVPGEQAVEWLNGPDEPSVAELLDLASPRTSARPGDAEVRRWAGIGGAGSRLDACAADTSAAPGVGHISAIATRPECRGLGLGTAITAWVTRRLLVEFDIVTLGLYADNPTARRLYDRLGYADEHHFTSGELVRS